jgi:hypothetical protein
MVVVVDDDESAEAASDSLLATVPVVSVDAALVIWEPPWTTISCDSSVDDSRASEDED